MKKSDVVIVVPVYREWLDWFEKISLKQLFQVLSHYDICFVAPDCLDIKYQEAAIGSWFVEYFSVGFFLNTKTYSSLCLSREFYERFLTYKYMLICQTDAFVFSDRVMEFVRLGYDYIGAPGPHYWTPYSVVGNGGLSLRKISAACRVLKDKNSIISKTPYESFFAIGEDNFFSYCGKKPEIDFSVPSLQIAGEFAVQEDTRSAIRAIRRRGLPFGVHAWHRMDYQVWKPIIEEYGYNLPEESSVEFFNSMERDREIRLKRYIHLKRREIIDKNREVIISDFSLDKNEKYILWGNGYWGNWALSLLKDLGLQVIAVFDKNSSDITREGITICKPTKSYIEKLDPIILICSDKYEKEILSEIKQLKVKCRFKCFITDDFEKKAQFHEYCKKFIPEIEGITVPIRFNAKEIVGKNGR